jgi:hypothetical protein
MVNLTVHAGHSGTLKDILELHARCYELVIIQTKHQPMY